jgi:hypothetical protein
MRDLLGVGLAFTDQPVELIFLEGEARDRKRLALTAGDLDPTFIRPELYLASRTFDTTPSRPIFQACLNMVAPSMGIKGRGQPGVGVQ